MAHRQHMLSLPISIADLFLAPLTSDTIKTKVETIKMSNPDMH